MKRFLLYIVTLVGLVSCSFESEGVYTDDSTEEYNLYDYYIDEYGNEGIIAYVMKSSNASEYIIAVSIDESLQSWGLIGERVYKNKLNNTQVRRPEFGVAMHQAMMSLGIERYPAQNWCNKKNGAEEFPRAGSWRLPTKNELDLIFGIRGGCVDALNAALRGVGGTPLSKEQLYWTCVEDIEGYANINGVESDYDPENRAVVTTTQNEKYGPKDRWIKKNKYYVRAIKYVYYKE